MKGKTALSFSTVLFLFVIFSSAEASSILCDDPAADNYNDYSECGCKYSDLFAGQQNSLCPSEISIMVFQEWMDVDYCVRLENGNKSWTKAQYNELLAGLGNIYNLSSFDYYEGDLCDRTPGEYWAERYQEPYENGDCRIDGVNQFTFPPAPWDGTFVSNIASGDLYWHFVGFMVRTEEATNPFSCCKQMFQSDDWTVFNSPDSSSAVKVTLKGPGALDIFFDPNGQDIELIELTDTTTDSTLTIKSKLKKIPIYLKELNITGSLKAIKGNDIALIGEITATGGIGKMQLLDTDTGSSVKASWIGRLSMKGDFAGDMMLTGTGAPPKGLALGKLSIKGMLDNSELIVNGNIGSVKVGTWGAGSTLAVGVDSGVDGMFFTDDDEATGGSLRKIKYKYYDTANGGDEFGIIADKFLKLNKKLPLPFAVGDFRIWEK